MNQIRVPYDVFVSSSSEDSPWVEKWLTPRLRAANLVVCTEHETFDIGVPRIVNAERAVERSRHTLIILSPTWLVSEWAMFAALLSQTMDPTTQERRILPLLLEPCEPPRRIAMLHAADFTQPEHHETQLDRVIAAINGTLHLAEVGAPLSIMLGPDGRHRRAMLRKVRTMWIDGLLTHSLYHKTLIPLQLHERPAAIAHPFDVLVQRPNRAAQPLHVDQPIIKVFDDYDGAVLILGEPGAGKTTLLLRLARDLLNRAEQDATHPMPIIFLLSTWVEHRLPLQVWLVDELVSHYDIPQTLAETWVQTEQILPLLDGLDEVPQEYRSACINAINSYRQGHGLLPLAVCSRSADYAILTTKLRLQTALVVQPLTRQQVGTYLQQLGKPLAAVRAALRDDPTLWDLLNTPLMLNILTYTYADQDVAAFQGQATLAERRRHLFTAYVQRMFEHGPPVHPYTPTQTRHWLTWLAWQMQRHNQTIFFLERLQPDWLVYPQRQVMRWLYMGIFALVGGGIFGLIFSLGLGSLVGGALGVGIALVFGQFGWKISHAPIRLTETVHWSWTGMRRHVRKGFRDNLKFSLSVGVGVGLLGGVSFGLGFGVAFWLFGWLADGLVGGLSRAEIEQWTRANQGIFRSGRVAVRIGLGFGLVSGLVAGFIGGLIGGPLVGLVSGLVAGVMGSLVFGGLVFGGDAWLRHYVLRLLFVQQGAMPFRYVPFLDFATQRIFLRHVGGGYLFIHRMLLEHFAEQYPGREHADAPTAHHGTKGTTAPPT